MRTPNAGHRVELLEAAARFVRAVVALPAVRRVSVLGSMVSAKVDPKDIDLLVEIADDADLAPLATHARRLQGRAQQLNRGADVFLADVRGTYLGRTCHWRDCRSGVRASCDAVHCGRRSHLHDDLDTIRLEPALVAEPPVTLWPQVVRRVRLPPDVERMVEELERGLTGDGADAVCR